MQNLVKFLSILQLTREQPLYGYFPTGIKAHETSNIAEHCYLAGMVAWALCDYINQNEKLVAGDRVIKMCLVHDLGELFGGDVSGPLSRKRPDIKALAKQIELANLQILTSFVPDHHGADVRALHQEFEAAQTTEAQIAHIADKVEQIFFIENRNLKSPHVVPYFENHIKKLTDPISDERIKARLREFFTAIEQEILQKGFRGGEWLLMPEKS